MRRGLKRSRLVRLFYRPYMTFRGSSWSLPLLAAADVAARYLGAFITLARTEVDIDAIGMPNRPEIRTAKAVIVPIDS